MMYRTGTHCAIPQSSAFSDHRLMLTMLRGWLNKNFADCWAVRKRNRTYSV